MAFQTTASMQMRRPMVSGNMSYPVSPGMTTVPYGEMQAPMTYSAPQAYAAPTSYPMPMSPTQQVPRYMQEQPAPGPFAFYPRDVTSGFQAPAIPQNMNMMRDDVASSARAQERAMHSLHATDVQSGTGSVRSEAEFRLARKGLEHLIQEMVEGQKDMWRQIEIVKGQINDNFVVIEEVKSAFRSLPQQRGYEPSYGWPNNGQPGNGGGHGGSPPPDYYQGQRQ